MSFILGIIKYTVFAAVIIVAASLVKYRGETISDHTRHWMSHAEHSLPLEGVKNWARDITRDVNEVSEKDRRELDQLILRSNKKK